MTQDASAPPPLPNILDRPPGDPRAQGRAANIVEPALTRSRRGARRPADAAGELSLSTRVGDLPDGLGKRYFSEPSQLGRRIAFYEGPGAKRAAFHDHGERLTTTQTHPTITRDLARIAQHRGWSVVRVTGEDEFRRQTWLEARALGLDVKGYKPRARDEQELAARLKTTRDPAIGGRPAMRLRRRTGRARQGKRGRAPRASSSRSGRAPYRRREGAPLTAFVRLDRDGQAPLDVWGSRPPAALAKAQASVGDRIRISRDTVERLERSRAPQRSSSQDRAERFRRMTSAQAARDPDLGGAQSHLAVLDALIDRLVRDPDRRATFHAEARAIVADELAQGRRFTSARIREVEPALAHELAAAARAGRERSAEHAQGR